MNTDEKPVLESLEALLSEHDIHCPYCGERISVIIDHNELQASYFEDCQVCCQPIELTISADDNGMPRIEIRREDE